MALAGGVHVAGNAVLDLVVRAGGLGGAGDAVDGWGANVEVLREPVTPALGGCGAAPAWVLGRLGQAVTLSTNLAADAFGQLLASWLGAVGVTLAPQPAPCRATAVHIIHVDGARRRSSYWRGDKVDWGAGLAGRTPAWYVATGYGAVDAHDAQVLTALCRDLRGRGARVLFDPSPWFAGRIDAAQMLDLWRHVDVLSGTEDELAHWAGASGAALAPSCLRWGPSLVAVKRGPEGARWATAGGSGEVPARAVDGNSVGAGDAFNARLLFGLSRGESAGQAVAAAVVFATRVVAAGRGVFGAFAPTA